MKPNSHHVAQKSKRITIRSIYILISSSNIIVLLFGREFGFCMCVCVLVWYLHFVRFVISSLYAAVLLGEGWSEKGLIEQKKKNRGGRESEYIVLDTKQP